MTTAGEIDRHLRSLGRNWLDPERTTDRVVAGDPDRVATGIAVAWMSTWDALREAVDRGCSLFITHEPTFFAGHDDEKPIFRFAGVREKREWLSRQNLTVVRCHDVWDLLPGDGVTDSWAELLDLGEPMALDGYFGLYDVTGHTAASLAERVASRTVRYGQEAVELVGPPDRPVHRLALGTGAETPLPRMLDRFDLDVALCSDDGFTYWHAGALAIDLGIPVIVVNHAVSELHGIERLAAYLRRSFPDLPVHHIEQRCMYRLVRPRNNGS